MLQSIPDPNEKELPVKRLRVNFPCESCGKANGPQVFCMECGQSSVHKKKCAGLTGEEWLCKRCTKSSSTAPNDLTDLDLSRNSSTNYENTVKVLIDKVVDEAKKDKYFYENLVKRQQKYAEINAEVSPAKRIGTMSRA